MNLFALLLPALYFVSVSQCSTPITVIDPPPNPNCDRINEIYVVGISACGNTCENYGKKCNIFPYVPIRGCDCIPGFARIVAEGECISVNNPRCQQANGCNKPNEVYSDSISPCGNTCENYGQRCTIVNKKAITGCDCIKGYARLGENGRCVKVDSSQCVQRYSPSLGNCALKKNEEYVENTYNCQALCETVLSGPCQLLSFLPINDCFCKRGYARIEAGGPCVPICSKKCLNKVKIPGSCPA